jgi:hypothetical protein
MVSYRFHRLQSRSQWCWDLRQCLHSHLQFVVVEVEVVVVVVVVVAYHPMVVVEVVVECHQQVVVVVVAVVERSSFVVSCQSNSKTIFNRSKII